jgi:hypothetical protein
VSILSIFFPKVFPVKALDKPPGDEDGTAGGPKGLWRCDTRPSAFSSCCSSSALDRDLRDTKKGELKRRLGSRKRSFD